MLQKTLTRTVLVAMVAAVSPLRADDARPVESVPKGPDDGYVSIFNGRDLTGWTYKKTRHYNEEVGYVVKDGLLIANGRCGNLYTDKSYRDYSFRFEFRFEPGEEANSGLGMRTEIDGSYPADTSYEIQILDDHAPKYAKLKPAQYHGSIYGKVPAKRGHLKPTGEWNTQVVTVNGDKVTIILNGAVILEADLGNYPKAIRREEGHLCIAGHLDGISFRNLMIKEIE